MTVRQPIITCLCFRCMDYRLDSRAIHGDIPYVVANAGASMPQSPNDGRMISFQVASFFLLLEQSAVDNKRVIISPSGHYDCLDVKKIWQTAIGEDALEKRHQETLYRAYLDLALKVKDQNLDRDDSLRLLAAAKTLYDTNNFFTYPEVQKAAEARRLKFVVYFEDPTFTPHRLFVYDPALNEFTEPSPSRFHFLKMRYTRPGPRLIDVKQSTTLLDKYKVRGPVCVDRFVVEEAGRIRARTSILLPENAPPRFPTWRGAGEHTRYVIQRAVRVIRSRAQHTPDRRLG